MVTQNGIIKKSSLEAYSHPRANGIIAINLDDDDKLIDSQITTGENDIILATSFGYANRFSEEDVRAVGRNSRGVIGIKLRKGDKVVAMVIIKREGTLLAISENGFGKRTPIDDYPKHKRGSKGVITLRTSARNGSLVSLMEVVDNDDLMIVTREGMIIRQCVNLISVINRATQGVKLIKLNKTDEVYDIARITPQDDEQEEIHLEDLNCESEDMQNYVDNSEPETQEEEGIDDDTPEKSEENEKNEDEPKAVQEEIEF